MEGFALSKLVCAAAMRDLHVRHGVAVATVAIEREIRNGEKSINLFSNGKEIATHFATHYSNYTFVTHGVAFHVDQGKEKNTSFLENRIVLRSKRNPNEPCIPEGRGYAGADYFEYALLDW